MQRDSFVHLYHHTEYSPLGGAILHNVNCLWAESRARLLGKLDETRLTAFISRMQHDSFVDLNDCYEPDWEDLAYSDYQERVFESMRLEHIAMEDGSRPSQA